MNSELLFKIGYPVYGYPGIFQMRKCKTCGLLFNSPRLQDSDFLTLYDKNYYFFNRRDADEFERIVNVYRRTVALVEEKISPKKVLEIGSAKGYLLAVLQHLGWEVQGVEISSSASEYAMKKFGLKTFIGTLENYVQSSKIKFPLVLAIDLIEHVLYPAEFISCINEIMQDEGILIIDMPNGGSHNILIEKSNWKGFNPFHIFLFSKQNITTILNRSGFIVESIFTYGNEIAGNNNERDINSKKLDYQLKNIAKSILRKVHLLHVSRAIYRKAGTVLLQRCRTLLNGDNLSKAVGTIRSYEGTYFETADNKGPFAECCKGDNIVVIARKT
jgi:2-polyprenyl-3-methyl-5-hydroxy-6-metoxy-1,4-benzoquinol methylase